LDKRKTATPAAADDSEVRRQRSTLRHEIAIAFPVAVVLWLATYYFLPR
jgi:hypothetical protein